MGARRLALGPLTQVALDVKHAIDRGTKQPILVMDAQTSHRIDLDVRGTDDEVVARLTPRARPRAPGRPKLGVIPREVTLLPRHWEWLQEQPGGASVTLRKLVDQARKSSVDADRIRQARESAYRFILELAGDRPGFEEATRALFAGDSARFARLIARWPADIRAHATALLNVQS